MQTILSFEQLCEHDMRISTALGLCFRYYCEYKAGGEKNYLLKAYHCAVVHLGVNRSNIKLYFAVIFLNLEIERLDKAEDMLKNIKSYRRYLRRDDTNYLYYNFLYALFHIRKGKPKAANKHITRIDGNPGSEAKMLLGTLYCELNNFDIANQCFVNAYSLGNRSPMLFFSVKLMLDLFENGDYSLLIPFVKWAAAHKAPINRILGNYAGQLNQLIDDINLCKTLYSQNNVEWLLRKICLMLIEKHDLTEGSYFYYREAEVKQFQIPLLYNFLIKCAAKNRIDETTDKLGLSHHALATFFAEGELDSDVKPIVYHMLLTDKKYSDLTQEYKNDILQFAGYCLENNMRGRHYFSLYRYIMFFASREGDNKSFATAAKLIIPPLFMFRLTLPQNSGVKTLWVCEPEKKDAAIYKAATDVITVLASSPSFEYFCFDASQKELIGIKPSIVRLVENADIRLYRELFKRGTVSTEVLINLSKQIIAFDEIDDFELSADILQKTLLDSSLTNRFKNMVSAALGRLYMQAGEDKKAFNCFKVLNTKGLSAKSIEQMLIVFVEAGEHELAMRLIESYEEFLPEKTLFYAVRKIIEVNEFHERVAVYAFRLILKGRCDQALLNVAINHYRASQAEWHELAKVISALNVSSEGLDELILNRAIWMRKCDKKTQEDFARLFRLNPENGILTKFAQYLCYEIICNDFVLEFETVDILEKLAERAWLSQNISEADRMLHYSLSKFYITNSVSSLKSDAIMRKAFYFAEQDSFLLPCFKQIKDKNIINPYIEKNQAFIYKALPEKTVKLCFRQQGGEWCQKPMKYHRFGIFSAQLPVFYGESLEFYYAEEMPSGSIATHAQAVENTLIPILDRPDDMYYVINSLLINEKLFRYDRVEAVLNTIIKEPPRLRSKPRL